ncbi:3-propionate hydroxylase [Exophiala viscosa]|uniref:3-propionate hydroxylase n=1 Tax=Exophiala viscosa TaxID=2486360 RepID=A0AAN6IJB9_9EURO|nr:3-propionate hydroxylase [Exophiala viscosa]
MAPARLLSTNDQEYQSHPAPEHDVPVLIIGAGPAGLLQAHLLSQLGISCLVVERYASRLAAPKAHALSPRSLEICRQFSLDTTRIRRLGTSRKDAFYVNFITNLTGQQIGRLPYERMDADVLNDTPEMIHNIPQPMFEDLVYEEIISQPDPKKVQIMKNVSFVSFQETKGGVITTVEDRATSRHFTIRSRHVVACDGARSRVRDFCGIQTEGAISEETMMTIHFQCDLRPILGDRKGMLHWVLDPETSGFIINYDPAGNQVLICNFDAQKRPVDIWDEALCRATILSTIGRAEELKVLSWRPWVLSRKVANKYRCGNVFLAGDAAHSFPPTGGLGLNAGIADVHNLAWKIAAVHHGWASSTLLDTYKAERRHVAMVYSEQSVKNGLKIFSFLKTLGATTDDVGEARSELLRVINDPTQADVIAAHVEDQREHFDNLELHIGYVYNDTAIPKHASHFTPKYVAGARLAHAWIHPLATNVCQGLHATDVSYIEELSVEEVQRKRFSTLDLCSKSAFTLITSKDNVWHHRYDQLSGACHPSLPLNLVVEGQDFEFIDVAAQTKWCHGFGLHKDGAVLVRPDQHCLAVLRADDNVECVVDILHDFLGITGT